MSEARSQVCGQETRKGYIKACPASRKQVSIFESKKDYPPLQNCLKKLIVFAPCNVQQKLIRMHKIALSISNWTF